VDDGGGGLIITSLSVLLRVLMACRDRYDRYQRRQTGRHFLMSIGPDACWFWFTAAFENYAVARCK